MASVLLCTPTRHVGGAASSMAEKEKDRQRKTDNRNYQHKDREPARNSAVPNNARHDKCWEKDASGANIVVPQNWKSGAMWE
jgi:hypothetical protein